MNYYTGILIKIFSLTFLICFINSVKVSAQITLPYPLLPNSTAPHDACSVIRPRPWQSCTGQTRKPLSEPLLESVDAGDMETLKNLIAAGADVNFKGENGATALALAASYKDLEMVELLLKAGARTDAQTAGSETALMAAASGRCTKITEMLLKAGANVNAESAYGYTALFNAADSGNLETVKILLAAGAGVSSNESSSGDRSAYIAAVRRDNLEMVKLILAHDKENKLNDSYHQALGTAVSSASLEMINFLLERRVNKDKNILGLMLGIPRDRPDIVKTLLAAGADPNVKAGQTASPLTWAASNGFVDIVKLLIEAKADVNVKDYWGPLITAARRENTEVMGVLLKAGANINQRAYDGKTALMYAAWEGKPASVKFLLENRADVNLRDEDDNVTALSLAIKSTMIINKQKQNEIIELLKDAGAVS